MWVLGVLQKMVSEQNVIEAQDAHSLDQVAEHPKCIRVSLTIVRSSRETYGGLLSAGTCIHDWLVMA